jgi:hypothetical protein
MNNPLDALPKSLKELAGAWAGYAALGSFVLYLCGYLALRFELMAFGVTSDLAVLDERYLFAGARFLVYLAAALPNLVFLLLPVAVLVLLAWRRVAPGRRERLQAWWLAPQRLAWLGLLWTLGWIQFVMRQCWALSNLLFIRELPDMQEWVRQVLLDEGSQPFFFAALLGACAVSALLLRPLWSVETPSSGLRLVRGLLSLLVAIQLLMLPVNYGMLVHQGLARVAAAGPRTLAAGESAWLVWEGKDSISFLVLAVDGRRSLLTVDRKQVATVEVLGFDAILPRLLAAAHQTKESAP